VQVVYSQTNLKQALRLSLKHGDGILDSQLYRGQIQLSGIITGTLTGSL